MDKELFIKTMENIEDLYNRENELNIQFKNEFVDFNGLYIYDRPISILIELLEKLTNDESEWISYFIWEQNFGKEHKLGDVLAEDGTPIPLFSYEDLYNIIYNK